MFVGRLNADGTLDTTGDADPTTSFNGATGYRIISQIAGGWPETLASVAVHSDGKIVVLGTSYTLVGNELDLFLARFNPDGSYDTNFDGPAICGDGKFNYDLTGETGWEQMYTQQLNRLLETSSSTAINSVVPHTKKL